MSVCRTRVYTLLEIARISVSGLERAICLARLLCINNINSQRYPSLPSPSHPSLSFSFSLSALNHNYILNQQTLRGWFANFIKLRQRATRRFQRAQTDLLRGYLASYSISSQQFYYFDNVRRYSPVRKEKDDHSRRLLHARTECISFSSRHHAFHPVPKGSLLLN